MKWFVNSENHYFQYFETFCSLVSVPPALLFFHSILTDASSFHVCYIRWQTFVEFCLKCLQHHPPPPTTLPPQHTHSLWDLSFLTRDWTPGPMIVKALITLGKPLFMFKYNFEMILKIPRFQNSYFEDCFL